VGRLVNEFSWSKSRDELFRECRRKYYYDKYGSWGGWERGAEPRPRALYVAKNLKSRHMWLGEVVHSSVEDILNALRTGRKIGGELVLTRLTDRMRREFRESRDGRYRERPKRCLGLFEHEYEVSVDDETWFNLHEKARSCVLYFLESDILRDIETIPADRWLALETLADTSFEGDTVYLKMDYAARTAPGVMIVDWKTGEKPDVDANVQLSCYGLYAVTVWNTKPGDVETVEYNLATRAERRRRLLPADIDWIKHYIRASTAAMKELLVDPQRNIAVEEDFPFTDNELTCRWCNFRKWCRKFTG
jgi:hypothetical protein